MQTRISVIFIAILGHLSFGTYAIAQSSNDIVGSWSFVLNETTNADGSKVNTYGAKPKGIIMFDSGGHFSLFIANPDRPKFASGNRMQGTSEEYKAAVQGSISYFGRYSVDESAKAINFELEASSFPNWDGVTQKRPFSISGDELRFTNSSGSSGGAVLVVMKRLK
jgi:Lipocalin-like domain